MPVPHSRRSAQGRPFGAGPAGTSAKALLGLTASVVVLSGVLGGCGRDGTTPGSPAAAVSATATYGSYPSFLPSNILKTGFAHRVVDATAHDPALATQGDTVRVHIGSATVLATVAGPEVPIAGQQYQAPESPATWTVVLRQASKPLALDPATFQAVDESGAVHDLVAQGHVPKVLGPGQTARFKLFSPGFETGEGRLRWIPVGHLAPVEWDFTVETD